ncbi:hypothetical protein C0993_003071 [Termitomyces sp. T159_Od127]|nr:hypothetical protein C0993_003071 [Termitomyces sp. T159_Od127]
MRLACSLLVTLPVVLTSANFLQTWQNENSGNPAATGGNVTDQNDVNAMNYLLSVANLQNAFYKQNLEFLDENAFNSSGYGPETRNNYAQIQQNKQAQVDLLAQTLGTQATPFCSYDFHVTNASNFTAASQVVESIGTSAYVGSIADISNSTLQTWAASILASNARTAAYTASVNGNQPFNGPFETPLSPQEVTTLSSPYIISCPPNSTNIYQPGRNLTITQSGNDLQFVFDNSSTGGQPLFAVFRQGLKSTFVPINDGIAPIPANSSGIIFAEVTNSSTLADENTIVAGPSFLNIPVANGTNGTVPATGPFTTIASSAATMTPTSSAPTSVAPTSEQSTSTSVVTATSTQESTVVVTATSSQATPSQESTVVVTSTSSPESTVVVTATSPPGTVVVTATASV